MKDVWLELGCCDEPEDIQRCLSCTKPECNNCLTGGCKTPKKLTSVKQVDAATGEVIAVFHSVKDAVEATNINKKRIYECLRGEKQTAGGFKWEKV